MKKIFFLLVGLILLSANSWAITKLERNYKPPLPFLTAEVNQYLRQDEQNPVNKQGIVITGSSSIKAWQPEIHNDFTQVDVIARGFGGSNMNDLLHFSEALITQYQPRAVAIYEGDNDIAQGISPQQVLKKFIELNNKIRLLLPDIRTYFISIKPSIARQTMWPEMEEANTLIQAICNLKINCIYIDVASKLLKEGLPKQDIFIDDGLHLNKKGYQLWSDTIVSAIEAREVQNEK